MKKYLLMTVAVMLLGNCLHAQFLKLDLTKNQMKRNPDKYIQYSHSKNRSYLVPHGKTLEESIADGDADSVQRLNFLSQAVALPFKYRVQKNGQWEAGFSLGTATGVQWMTNKKNKKSNYLGMLFYIGASQLATIDSTNSKDTTGATRIGPTFAFTGFWQITKWNNLDLEWTLGWDYDPKNRIDQWAYNGKLWISFGFGINLTKGGSSN